MLTPRRAMTPSNYGAQGYLFFRSLMSFLKGPISTCESIPSLLVPEYRGSSCTQPWVRGRRTRIQIRSIDQYQAAIIHLIKEKCYFVWIKEDVPCHRRNIEFRTCTLLFILIPGNLLLAFTFLKCSLSESQGCLIHTGMLHRQLDEPKLILEGVISKGCV